MTDQRLRQLAREASACPSQEAEAALLRARLRAGTLSLERLELAAYCGHEGARAVLGPSERLPGSIAIVGGGGGGPWWEAPGAWGLSDFVAGLSRWGPTVQVRAAVAAARVALPFWDASRSEVRDAAEEGLRRVKDWLDGHDGTTHRIRAAHDGGGPFAGVPHGIRSVLSLALRAEAGDMGALGIDWPAVTHWAIMQFHRFAPERGEPRVRAAIQSSLITWALSEAVAPEG